MPNIYTYRTGFTIFSILAPSLVLADDVSQSKVSKDLPTVEVVGTPQDKTFQTPKAVSHRDASLVGEDLNTTVRNMPGTFTQHDIGQGGLSVNIRGLEGLGRVNTTIDGVTQTFFQTNLAHGWNGSTTYVDENFITGVDVERGVVGGVNGVNALGGAAEFRTIDVSDLVDKDKNFGGKIIVRHGSNGYGSNGMLGVATRQDFSDDASVGLLGAVGLKNKGGYKNGAGETIASSDYDENVGMESGVKSRSGLIKFQYKPNRFHDLVFSHIQSQSRFRNNHTPLEVDSQMSLLKYHYKPLSDFVNLDANIAYTKNKQEFLDQKGSSESFAGRKTNNPSVSFSLQNKSVFEFKDSNLALTYGAKLMRNHYNGDKQGELLAEGQQNLNSLFTDFQWDSNRWVAGVGFGYEGYDVKGYLPETDDDGAIVFPKGGNINFSRKEHHFNPRVNIAYRFTDWLQFYANLGKSSRSATVQEVMYASNPNNPYSINPYLKGESSVNRDLGFNIVKHSFLKDDDHFRLKVNYFDNSVKNYIVQRQFYLCAEEEVRRCSRDERNDLADVNGEYDNGMTIGIFRNLPGVSRMRGWEVEGGYDMGQFYANFSWSKTKTKFPIDYLSQMGFSHIRALPSSVWSIDLGTRLLNQRLTLGSRISYTGKDTVADEVDFDTDKPTTSVVQSSPKLIDLYAIYQVNKNFNVFFNIDNLTNRVYNYPLSGGTLGTGNLGGTGGSWANQGTGRGRTIYGGLSLKF